MSEHNMIYWSGLPYLGLGPRPTPMMASAGSWNISSLKDYMEGIAKGRDISETEHLSTAGTIPRLPDHLLTNQMGCDPGHIEDHFGKQDHQNISISIHNHFWRRDPCGCTRERLPFIPTTG